MRSFIPTTGHGSFGETTGIKDAGEAPSVCKKDEIRYKCRNEFKILTLDIRGL